MTVTGHTLHDDGSEPAATSVPTSGRLTLVDNARAVGIVLVVAGHAPALPAWTSDFIYAFHMPLFFLLSGLMVGRSRLSTSPARRAAALARSLLLPYLVFFAISWAYWLVAKRHGLRAAEFETLAWWNPLNGLVSGSADLLYVNVVLWFFPCLFVTALVHHVSCKLWSPIAAAAVFTLIAVAFVLLHDSGAARWLWSADCAVVAVAFYATGSACHPFLRQARLLADRRLLAAIALLFGALCFGCASLTGHVDLNHLAFGRIPALYLPMGAFGVTAAIAVAALLPASPLARWLSTNTLVIFPLHFLFFSIITGVALVVLHLSPDFKEGSESTALVYIVIALILSVPAAWLLHRAFPWLIRDAKDQRSAPSTRPGTMLHG